MLDPNYDSNLVLDTLLAVERTKKATIERHIAALEYLKLTGAKNRLLSPLRGISLDELGQTILNIRNAWGIGYTAIQIAVAIVFVTAIWMLVKKIIAKRELKALPVTESVIPVAEAPAE